MMALKDLKEILEQSGFPVAYRAFPAENVPDMPFITYETPFTSNFGADGKVYANIENVQVQLWTHDKDIAAEKQIEAVMGWFWNKTNYYEEDERCMRTVYEFEI